jgi:hypothetical protein
MQSRNKEWSTFLLTASTRLKRAGKLPSTSPATRTFVAIFVFKILKNNSIVNFNIFDKYKNNLNKLL